MVQRFRTGQSTRFIPPESDARSTENGSRVSPLASPLLATTTLSCSAPSRSAGCTRAPCHSARRRSRAPASRARTIATASTISSVRYAGPYSRPTRQTSAYSVPATVAESQRVLMEGSDGCGSALLAATLYSPAQ